MRRLGVQCFRRPLGLNLPELFRAGFEPGGTEPKNGDSRYYWTSDGNGPTGSDCPLRGGDGSRHSQCRFRVLQKPILGTADSEYWNRLGVRGVLHEIPEASMNKR